MATQAEYDAVAKALLAQLLADEKANVPAMFQSMIPADAAPKLAKHCAHVAVDALDKMRKS
jgi:hypothetical protein